MFHRSNVRPHFRECTRSVSHFSRFFGVLSTRKLVASLIRALIIAAVRCRRLSPPITERLSRKSRGAECCAILTSQPLVACPRKAESAAIRGPPAALGRGGGILRRDRGVGFGTWGLGDIWGDRGCVSNFARGRLAPTVWFLILGWLEQDVWNSKRVLDCERTL